MNIIKKTIDGNYNQFKEEMTKRMWDKLNPAISEIENEVISNVAIFKQDSE